MIKVPLSRPDITDKERKAVLEVLESPQLCLGAKLQEFEEKIAGYVGVKHAIAVNSGTSALHLAIRALDIQENDEVITTPFSFISSSNCILYEKAKPIFVDIDPSTLNIDVDSIEQKITEKTKAILAVDVFGHSAEWDSLEELSKKYGLKLIEDSCESLGGEYKGRKTGSFGDVGTFAFYPNKQITTGEGGMVVTDNDKTAELCSSMRNQGRGRDGKWFVYVRLGYNYRISDINCALGIAQMERIEEIVTRRAEAADTYGDKLKDLNDIELPGVLPHVRMGWFVYVIRLKEEFNSDQRDQILSGLRNNGIECSNYFPPIHLQPYYRDMFGYKEGDFPVTESISMRTIALPFYNNISVEQIDYVAKNLKQEIFKISDSKLISSTGQNGCF